MEIEKMLVLSTAHLTEDTAKALPSIHMNLERMMDVNPYRPGWWPTFTRLEGWVFYIPTGEDYEDTLKLSPPSDDLLQLIKFAADNGCSWLMLDRDGPIEPTLPQYKW